ncbi:MAG: glycosyltransferase [Aureispira sp.]|nr:glycosyltransferase [Aureispira sp.]
MNNQPLVSIIALSYNHAIYLEETLDSIVNQSYKNIQLIIRDDCSSDNSVEVIKKWIKKNKVDCIFHFQEKNQGICKGLNEALKDVKGTYYQAISCDDVLLPEKTAIQVALLEQNPNLAFIHSNGNSIDENSTIVERLNQKVVREDGVTEDFFKDLLFYNGVLAPSVLVRKSMLPEAPVYDESLSFEDWDLWLNLSLKHDVYYLNEPLVQYRVLSTSMMRSAEIRKRIEKDSIKVLKQYLGHRLDCDAIIEKTIFDIRERHDLYEYSLKALLMKKTSFLKFKQKLRLRTRIKNYLNKK